MVRAKNLKLGDVNQYLYQFLVESNIIFDIEVDESAAMPRSAA